MAEDPPGPRNRKERRAFAKANGQKFIPTSAADIPLSQPSRSAPDPKTKTLLEIAQEKQSLLQNGQPFVSPPSSDTLSTSNITTTTINPDGTLSHSTAPSAPAPNPDDLIGPFGTSLIHALTLSMLYFTLTLLVYHQYAETYTYGALFYLTLTTFPVLLLLVYILHPYASLLPTQVLFAGMSVAAGCYLLRSSHEEAYLAVMKRAPSLGTLWVWCVVEMKLPWAVGSLGVVAGYAWRWGFLGKHPYFQAYIKKWVRRPLLTTEIERNNWSTFQRGEESNGEAWEKLVQEIMAEVLFSHIYRHELRSRDLLVR